MNIVQYTKNTKITWNDINTLFRDCLTLLRTLNDILYLSTNDQCILNIKIEDHKNLLRYTQDLKDIIKPFMWLHSQTPMLPTLPPAKLTQLEMKYLYQKLQDLLDRIKTNYEFW